MSKEEIKSVEILEKAQLKIRGRYIDHEIQMAASRAKPYLNNILDLIDVNALGFPWMEAETIFHALWLSTQNQRQVEDRNRIQAATRRAKEIKEYQVWRANLDKQKLNRKVEIQKKVDDQKKVKEKVDKTAQAEALKRAQDDPAKKVKPVDAVKLQKQQAPKIAVHKAASLENARKNANRGYSQGCHGNSKPQSAESIAAENAPQIHSKQQTNQILDIPPFILQSPEKSPGHPTAPVNLPSRHRHTPQKDRTAAKLPVADLLRDYNPIKPGSSQPPPPPRLPLRAHRDTSPAKNPVIVNLNAAAAAANPNSPPLKSLKPALKKSIQNFKEEPGMRTWLPGMARPEVENNDYDANDEKAEKARKAHEKALALRSEVRKF